jgi:hypothetical protein
VRNRVCRLLAALCSWCGWALYGHQPAANARRGNRCATGCDGCWLLSVQAAVGLSVVTDPRPTRAEATGAQALMVVSCFLYMLRVGTAWSPNRGQRAQRQHVRRVASQWWVSTLQVIYGESFITVVTQHPAVKQALCLLHCADTANAVLSSIYGMLLQQSLLLLLQWSAAAVPARFPPVTNSRLKSTAACLPNLLPLLLGCCSCPHRHCQCSA